MFDWRVARGVTRAVLVRHGAPETSARGRCYGRMDVGLSPLGRSSAARTAAWLGAAPIATVYASPLRRAIESARPLAEPRLIDDLRELDFGVLDGMAYHEAAARHPDIYRAWMERPTEVEFPGGESYSRMRLRVLAAFAALREAHRGSTFAVVSHGGTNRVIVGDALGLEPRHAFRFGQPYSCVNVVDWFEDGTPVVQVLGAVPRVTVCR